MKKIKLIIILIILLSVHIGIMAKDSLNNFIIIQQEELNLYGEDSELMKQENEKFINEQIKKHEYKYYYKRNINWTRYWDEHWKYSDIIKKCCKKYNLDSNIIKAVISWESNWTPKARYLGCNGLMQVRGASFDPERNIESGCRMLAHNLKVFGNWYHALMAYNAGSGAARRMIRKNIKLDYPTNVLRIAHTLETLEHDNWRYEN